MKGGSVRTLEDEVLIQALQDQLPPLYKEPSSYTEGGGRHVFQAEWGGRKTRTRAIKVDKTPQEITSPRAARYFERNYNSEHELNIANHVAHPENHNLLMPIDGGKIVIDGQTRFWTSEPFVNSTQLNTYIQEHEDGLPAHEIKQLFTDYTHAYKVLEEHGVLHRDGSGRNFLVELDDNKDVKGWVTDWGNAGTAENIESKVLPTAGAREVMDPTLIFQGETASYDHRSEQFAIGTLLYKALTGKEIFDINPDTEYNPETRQHEQPYVRSAQTQQNLLFPNNTLDTLAAQKTVDTALKELLYERPVEYFKYKDVLSSALSIDRSNRYESLEELASYFSSAANFSNLKLNLHLTKWLTIAGVGAMMLVHTNGIQEELWQNTPLSLDNNINSELQYQNELFSAHAIISDEGTPEEIELQTAVSTEHLLAQPQSQHTLHVAYELHEPGVDRIDPFGTFNSHSRISSKGKIYIEELEDEHEFSRGVTYNKYPSRAGYLPVYTQDSPTLMRQETPP